MIHPHSCLPFFFVFMADIARNVEYEIKFVLKVIMLLAKEACIFAHPPFR